MKDNYSEAKLIREELAYIGRYLDGISPKLSKYQELVARKKELQQKLKGFTNKGAGSNPIPFRKTFTNFRDIVTPIVNPKGNVHNVHRIANRTEVT
jgi:hypothetical protein